MGRACGKDEDRKHNKEDPKHRWVDMNLRDRIGLYRLECGSGQGPVEGTC
jgi:hypothetical protein